MCLTKAQKTQYSVLRQFTVHWESARTKMRKKPKIPYILSWFYSPSSLTSKSTFFNTFLSSPRNSVVRTKKGPLQRQEKNVHLNCTFGRNVPFSYLIHGKVKNSLVYLKMMHTKLSHTFPHTQYSINLSSYRNWEIPCKQDQTQEPTKFDVNQRKTGNWDSLRRTGEIASQGENRAGKMRERGKFTNTVTLDDGGQWVRGCWFTLSVLLHSGKVIAWTSQ